LLDNSETFSANFRGRFGSLRSVIPGFWSLNLLAAAALSLYQKVNMYYLVKDSILTQIKSCNCNNRIFSCIDGLF
jgi:hypothetical protein